jgi:hypothetical protein
MDPPFGPDPRWCLFRFGSFRRRQRVPPIGRRFRLCESICWSNPSPPILMARNHASEARRAPRRGGDSDARVFRVLLREAIRVRGSPTGDVGLLYSGEGIEAVWVSKKSEKIDRRWFRYPRIDLLAVLQGRLKVEFPPDRSPPRVLHPGDVLVLPPNTPCRAYSWPRGATKPTVFLAVYRRSRVRKRSG